MKQYTSFELSGFNSSDKRLISRLKATNINDIIPTIDIPKPKRIEEEQKLKDQGLKKIGKILKEVGLANKKKTKEKQPQQQVERDSLKNISFEFAQFNQTKKRHALQIIQILEYLFSEFNSDNKTQYTAGNIYEIWEAKQILHNNKDTNLGDFIIKLPNPDCMPEHGEVFEKQSAQQMTLLSSLHYYEQMFSNQQSFDKIKQLRAKYAFIIAFYLLDIKGNVQTKKINQNKERAIQFMKQFNYYKTICEIDFISYLEKKKDQKFEEEEKKLNIQFYQKEINNLIYQSQKNNINFQFKAFKQKIYDRLNEKLRPQKQVAHDKLLLDDAFIVSVLSIAPSYSQIFRHFPSFIFKIVQEIKEKHKIIYRKKCFGGNLQKINIKGQLRWVLYDKRPKDVLTLLRKMIMYRLTRRGGLFVRTFLSQKENYIFMVIKASEQHLEKMAQNKNFQMQLEFGSIDLFAFEPVDSYFRPLRINKYIRDPAFLRKYSLHHNKEDKQQNTGEKSIQSESRNLYKKAQGMNEDQLRAKIILDQQQCDQMYRWISKTLSLKFIHGEQILNTQYNIDDIEPDIWPVYYIYNKLIIDGVNRLKELFQSKKQSPEILEGLKKNIGLLLRLLFLKSLNVSNDLYQKHRKTTCRGIKNLISSKKPLKNIWNYLGQDFPRGYWPYFHSQKQDRMWRKYQINQKKDRSKFTPSARTIITDMIITSLVNVPKSKISKLMVDYFPIHDPYILKNIKIQPFLNVLQSLVNEEDVKVNEDIDEGNPMRNMFIEYECEYTSEDFTKKSIVDKLGFHCSKISEFSVNTVAFYCGQKLAFFFEFRRFLMHKSFPWVFITFIIQILFWVEKSHVQLNGSSRLQPVNSVLMVIMAIINIIWVDRTIVWWLQREKSLARSFGTQNINEKPQLRVVFEGKHYRNLQTDQINYERVGNNHKFIKWVITFIFNISYIALMGATLLLIFVLKGQLYQEGYAQSTVTILPAVLISLSVQIFNFIYQKLVRFVIDFENRKTIEQYEQSLSTKSFTITFIVTYFTIFVYAFFSFYLEDSNLCLVKTSEGSEVNDCYFYVSTQLISSAFVDLIFTIIASFIPYFKFKYTVYKEKKQPKHDVTFNSNYFQSFDQFYEEQDRMASFMYSDQITNAWIEYTNVIIGFTTLILFGPIVPFLYPMIFITGIVSLHSKKYEIIFYSRRIVPHKAGSIGANWIIILEIMGVLGVFTNLALIIYVRQVFTQDKSIIFFACAFTILIIKYVVSLIPQQIDIVGERSKIKARNYVSERGLLSFNNGENIINTDIQNLFYDERRLKRRLPILHQAFIKQKN